MIRNKKYLVYNAKKLKNTVVGIAGPGNIGGQLPQRLVRMGVRNLKLTVPKERTKFHE
ncbi:hypothetical protein [Ligilactobacillus salivarius]|jgi:phosphoglycerate dehydrogenase-like enzyme|uniref:hypothetical protein n=1 Tax=Ligilactobacillus salivarius TaxID=1624 RepID=UPI0019D621CF|nr:hypothetical protein [Ligilactobacillus salivarius]